MNLSICRTSKGIDKDIFKEKKCKEKTACFYFQNYLDLHEIVWLSMAGGRKAAVWFCADRDWIKPGRRINPSIPWMVLITFCETSKIGQEKWIDSSSDTSSSFDSLLVQCWFNCLCVILNSPSTNKSLSG